MSGFVGIITGENVSETYEGEFLVLQVWLKNSLSSFFFESILGCGGQIELPKGYLKNIVKLVRQKNALCIADEVQTGFGRVGSNFWAFEEHGIK